MGWFSFGKNKNRENKKKGFRGLDWLEIEGRLRNLDIMAKSTDQAQTKQVIIQVDMLIDSVLKGAGIAGGTMGERLKALQNKVDRKTLDLLWKVHKKRNELVHDHGSFVAEWEVNKFYNDAKTAISNLKGLR